MAWISIMRLRYLWTISKNNNKESGFIFRNQDGDWSILLFFIVVMNKSRFDGFKLSYNPFLRYFYTIIVGFFIVYCVLQLTQFILLNKTSLMTQEETVDINGIQQYALKKSLYGYKLTVHYTKKDKEKSLSFFTSNKNKEVIKERFKELNINVM